MSAGTEGVVHYDVTRIGLIDALRYLPLTRHLHLYALARLADSILAVPPAPSATGFYMEGVKAERQRVAELAAEIGAMCTGCDAFRTFADMLRDEL